MTLGPTSFAAELRAAWHHFLAEYHLFLEDFGMLAICPHKRWISKKCALVSGSAAGHFGWTGRLLLVDSLCVLEFFSISFCTGFL